MYCLCMPTKTISVDLPAYECLCRLRRQPRESFSQVIRRIAEELGDNAAKVSTAGSTLVSELFAGADRLWLPSDAELDRLDLHQESPRPRRDPRASDRRERDE